MASINGVSGSGSSSSIYGTKNIISGLASGMDTESMIENALAGYKLKLSSVNQAKTKLEWKQESYRSIISKLSTFTTKYTSYTSSTNLLSSSFFNSAVTTSTKGMYADKVAATGKTNSDIQINGIRQLATSSRYVTAGPVSSSGGAPAIAATKALNLTEKHPVSTISGSLTLGYGSTSVALDFSKTEVFESGADLAAAINKKLAEENIATKGGNPKASEKIEAVFNETTNTIEFKEKGTGSNGVWVKSASGDFKSTLGVTGSSEIKDAPKSIDLTGKTLVNRDATVAEYLAQQQVSFTLDGVTKKITIGDLGENPTMDTLVTTLNEKLATAFGSDKITVSAESIGDGQGLKFTTKDGSTLGISGGEVLGLASSSESSYVNTSKKLGELLSGFNWDDTSTMVKASGAVKKVEGKDDQFKDEKGNLVVEKDGVYYRVDDKGNFLHEFKINDQSVGAFSKETALESVLTAINGNSEAGVSVSFSKTTNQFLFTAKNSGEAGQINIQGGLAGALFGNTVNADGSHAANYTMGQDAIVSVSVNGKSMELTRSSNSFEIDGLTVNLKGTFGYKTDDNGAYLAASDTLGNLLDAQGNVVKDSLGNTVTTAMATTVDAEGYLLTANGNRYPDAAGKAVQAGFVKEDKAEPVTFSSAPDTKKIIDVIKQMVTDYNAMATEIKQAYSTLPEQTSKGKPYEPLTDEDRAEMSETAIKNHEDKAKAGLLFGDSNLRDLYSQMLQALSVDGLESIGITQSFSNGLTTLTIDETKLESALTADIDKVRNLFTSSKDAGSSKNGLMQSLKSTLDTYGKTSGTKGILVELAGSTLAPTTLYNNDLYKQIGDKDKEIEKLQTQISNKIDFYTKQFTSLEQIIAQMNNQSSMLMGLTGGY